MTMATKHEVLLEHLGNWLKAKGDRKQRSKITQVVCEAIHLHPKSIPRAFKRLQMKDGAQAERRGRPTTYGPDVTAALKRIWEVAGEPCGENLHPLIAEYVEILERDKMWKYCSQATSGLLSMSLGTMKIRLSKFRRMLFLSHGKSTTNPSAIHSMVPVRSGPWDEVPVGTMQVDTVAHCDRSTAGDYVFTVNSTDVATLWSTRRAQWNKGQEATVASMEVMDEDLPFPVVEWHPDSGTEFVNWHCLEWSQDRGQRLTRSRPNHKNDNCFVEERNGHIVRRWVGYARLDVPELVDALNAVYDVLNPFLNHFVASRRTTSKERIGARWKVTREKKAGTPYQRVLLRQDVSGEVKTQLQQEHEKLNPLVLKKKIDQRMKQLFAILKRHESPLSQKVSR